MLFNPRNGKRKSCSDHGYIINERAFIKLARERNNVFYCF